MKISINTAVSVAIMLGGIGAWMTSSGKDRDTVEQCETVPANPGPNIDTECPYSTLVECCFITAGNTSQYVVQTQNGRNVMIRRNATSTVTIFGIHP
jgi:hypothetical protein